MDINIIIQGCLNGDKLSQSKLYLYYRNIAYGVIKKYIKNDMDAEDILQNGFIKLYQCINKYDSKGNFNGWLYQLFKNMSIDFLRSKKYTFEYLDNIDKPTFDEYDSNEEKLNDINSSIEKLSIPYKNAIVMFYYEDLTHKEIGRRLKISEGTSKSNLHKAKNKIIKEIKNKVYE